MNKFLNWFYKFLIWFDRNPINRFWFSMGLIAFVLIVPVMTWRAPSSITWVAILLNAGIGLWNLFDWIKLKNGTKS